VVKLCEKDFSAFVVALIPLIAEPALSEFEYPIEVAGISPQRLD
jgi:hypothetical protein